MLSQFEYFFQQFELFILECHISKYKEKIEQLHSEYVRHEANLNNALVAFFHQTCNCLIMISRTYYQTFQIFDGM